MRILLLVLWCYSIAHAKQLTFEDFVKVAIENDPNLELVISNRDKLEYLTDLGLPTRAMMLSASYETGNTSDSSLNTRQIRAGVSKEILESGTSVSLNRTENLRPDREEVVTEFRLEQAIYKNFFGRDIRFKKEILDIQKQKVKLEILELLESYTIDIATLYYDFAQSFFSFELAEKIAAELNKLKLNVVEKQKRGVATTTDVNRVLLQVAIAQEDLVIKKNALETKRNFLLQRCGTELKELTPVLDYPTQRISPIQESSLTSLRSYQVAKYDAEIAAGNRDYKQRTNKSDVDLVLGVNKDDSVRFGTSVDRQEQVIGVQVNIPIDNSLGNAQEMELALVERQKKLALKAKTQELKAKAESIYTSLDNLKSIVELAQQKVKLTEKIIIEDERRYNYGKIDLERIIDLRQNYSLYRYQYLSRLADYRLALLRWKGFSDTLDIVKGI